MSLGTEEFNKKIEALYLLLRQYIKIQGPTETNLSLAGTMLGYINKQASLKEEVVEEEDIDVQAKEAALKHFAYFYKIHSSSLGKLIFPDLDAITKSATDEQKNRPLDKQVDYFMLFQMLETSRNIRPGGSTRYWERSQTNQFFYVFSRGAYLRKQLRTLEQQQHPDAHKAILCLSLVQEQYDTLPFNIKTIQTDKDFQATFTLTPAAVLEDLFKIVDRPVYQEAIMQSAIATLTETKDFEEALQTIPSSFLSSYDAAIETLSFLYKKRSIIEQLKSEVLPESEDVSIKTQQLHTIVINIQQLSKGIPPLEKEDAYEEAKKVSQQLKAVWETFKTTYDQLAFASIEMEAVANTRFESAYTMINEYYQQSANTIQALEENVQTNYNDLVTVTDYQNQRRLTLERFESTYMVGQPTAQNTTDITQLIEQLKATKTILENNPILHSLSSLKAKDLNQELNLWEERLAEVALLLEQTKQWKENLITVEGVEGPCLEPQTFTMEKLKTVRTRKVTVAATSYYDKNNSTSSNDVKQGSTGDSNFLASVASMATTPNFFYGKDDSVIQIVHPETRRGRRKEDLVLLNPRKIQYFSVKMHLPIESDNMDKKTGRTAVSVLVYPTKDLVGKDKLEFAQKADSGELWVAILERAFAEIRGGYDNIEGGFPEEAFALLMNKSPEDFNRINFDDKAGLNKLKAHYGDNSLSNEEVITQKLTDSLKDNITLSTASESELIAAGGTKTDHVSANGNPKVAIYLSNSNPQPGDKADFILYANHTYSIEGGKNEKFRIRNPSGVSGETILFLTGAQIAQFFSAAIIL